VRPAVILDAGPLGLAGKPPGLPEAARLRAWVQGLRSAGSAVVVPEIARYEVHRELFRLGLAGGLRRLDQLHPGLAFLPIAGDVMDIASELWAGVRRGGLATAGDEALDGDAILAAQALALAADVGPVVVATTNVNHLARFPGVDAREWWTIG